MTTKKKKLLDTDPPILVGGGGSSYLWIRKDLDPQLVDPMGVPPSAPQPAHPNGYYCFRVQGNVAKINVDDGSGPGGNKPANSKKFNVRFNF